MLLLRGLSPLARGNLCAPWARAAASRPIPARTGQPRLAPRRFFQPGAYPRSHGATYVRNFLGHFRKGLSPLARGNLDGALIDRPAVRPIPARTGQPCKRIEYRKGWRAYPRSHGATRRGRRRLRIRRGLSPLARGNHFVLSFLITTARPIPARTGQPRAQTFFVSWSAAYPRSHGATDLLGKRYIRQKGLSPLARGNRPRPCCRRC